MGRRDVPPLDFYASTRRERRAGGLERMPSDESKSDAASASDSGLSSCSGSCASSNCSCDSECSACFDPYAEPSPPKSAPKPMEELERSVSEMARLYVLQHFSSVIRDELANAAATSQGLATSVASASVSSEANTGGEEEMHGQRRECGVDKRTIATQTSDEEEEEEEGEEEEKLLPPVPVRLRTIPTIDTPGFVFDAARSQTPVSRRPMKSLVEDLPSRAEAKTDSGDQELAKTIPTRYRSRAASDISQTRPPSTTPSSERRRYSLSLEVPETIGERNLQSSSTKFRAAANPPMFDVTSTRTSQLHESIPSDTNGRTRDPFHPRPLSPRDQDSKMKIDELASGRPSEEEKERSPSSQTNNRQAKYTSAVQNRFAFGASLPPRVPSASFRAGVKAPPPPDHRRGLKEPPEEMSQGDPFVRLDDVLRSPIGKAAVGDSKPIAPDMSFSSSRSTFPSTSVAGNAMVDLLSLGLTMSEGTCIASGRRGPVYQAYCGFTKLAVKVVRRPKSKAANLRVEAEMKVLERLPDHPNLVRHHGFTTLTDSLKRGVVTEYAHGGDSVEKLLYRPGHIFYETDKHRMILQVADALEFLHSHGVPHRDLTWRHVLYTYKTPVSVKLIDYGLPSLRIGVSSSDRPERTDITPEYASPQVLRGEISSGDIQGWKQSDIFSFTVLLVELLIEEPPWEGELPNFTVNGVAKQDKRPYSVQNILVRGKKSTELEQIIREGWHEDPTRRPTAAEMRSRLQSAFRTTIDSSTEFIPNYSFATTVSDSSEQPPDFSLRLRSSLNDSLRSNPAESPHSTSNVSAAFKEESHSFWMAQSLPPRPTAYPSQNTCSGYGFAASSSFSSGQYSASTSPLTSVSLASLKFEISDSARIAVGRRGSLYRASSGFNQLAVKLINKPITAAAERKFHQDASSLRLLPDHPCLVRYHGYTSVQNTHQRGIVTDFVIGSQTWIDRLYCSLGRTTDEEKLCMLLRVSDALAFLHSHGVTHRDLTLKHILYAYDSSIAFGVTKLVGFGFPSLRRNFTPEYASPEVLRGDLSLDDDEGWKKSDIFSFAVLVVEVLMERKPWEDELPMFFVKAMASRGERAFKAADLRLFGQKCSDLEALVSAAWSMDPRQRPSALEFQTKLTHIFEEIATIRTPQEQHY